MTPLSNKASNNNVVIGQKSFIRDGRAPIPKELITSKIMSANKSRNTKPELVLRKALWANGIKGYRLHWKKAPGSPDIVFPHMKLAIFVNGCFWHRCPNCKLPIPKSNSLFWKEKFKKNIHRDKQKICLLNEAGWICLVFWECELKRDLLGCVTKVKVLSNK